MINAAGFTLDLDQPTLEETRNVNKKSVENPIDMGQDTVCNPVDLGDTDDSSINEQYQAFLTDPRRI